MSSAQRPRFLHPLIGSTSANWRKVRREYGEPDALGRARSRSITLTSTLGLPLRWYERVRHRRGVDAQRLDPPPVFIIGHWRSGTTNLHNHLLQDPQFGYVSFLQCLIPSGFLTLERPVRWYLEKRLPATRPMDQVPAGLSEPMSEDFALGSLTDLTHYHSYYFPKSAERVFRRTILFEDVSAAEIAEWSSRYRAFLQKVAYAAGGRRLLLKNPAHTGRIPHLLQLFPTARFIHVIRNPFPVYTSTCKLIDKFLDLFSLQEYDLKSASLHMLERYELLMRRYLRDRSLIPEGQLIEVRHEDMTADPLSVLERIYRELDLPGFDDARPAMEGYVRSLRDYQTNTYQFDDETMRRITSTCGFALEHWGYEPPAAARPSGATRVAV